MSKVSVWPLVVTHYTDEREYMNIGLGSSTKRNVNKQHIIKAFGVVWGRLLCDILGNARGEFGEQNCLLAQYWSGKIGIFICITGFCFCPTCLV